jgi:transposase
MDMSAAFEAASGAKMPQAEIVHDRFHVSKHLNEPVDRVRRTEHRKLQEKGKHPCLKLLTELLKAGLTAVRN